MGREPIGRIGDDLALVLAEVVQRESADQLGVLSGGRRQRNPTRLEESPGIEETRPGSELHWIEVTARAG